MSSRNAGADEAAGEGQGAPKTPAIVIGNQLAMSLGVSVGSELLLVSPFGGPPTPMGPGPRLKRFHVAGIFVSSFFQYDEVYTYVSIPDAQDFRGLEAMSSTGIEARTTDFYRSSGSRPGGEWTQLEFPYYTQDWKDFFPAFFQALKTERVMMFLLLTMIIMVAAFVIVATLIMMIMEKSSDIAILKAMGAEDEMHRADLRDRGHADRSSPGPPLGAFWPVIAVTHQLTWIQQMDRAAHGHRYAAGQRLSVLHAALGVGPGRQVGRASR